MSYLTLSVVCLLVFLHSAATAVPCLALADRISGQSRSVYYKSAGQLSLLGFWLQLFLFFGLGLDLLFGGAIAAQITEFWRLVFDLLLLALGASSILLLLSCLWQRSPSPEKYKSPVGTLILVLSCLHSLLALVLGSVLAWAFLQGLTAIWQPDLTLPTTWLIGLTRFSGIWLFACYLALYLLLALAAGHVFAIIGFILLRKRDDFGRDYYTALLTRKAGHALVFALFLLLGFGGGVILTWNYPLPHLSNLFGLGNEGMRILLACLGLSLPLAMFCLWLVAASIQPMRKKTMIWLALLLLFCWAYSWLGRIWI